MQSSCVIGAKILWQLEKNMSSVKIDVNGGLSSVDLSLGSQYFPAPCLWGSGGKVVAPVTKVWCDP